jgi:hypothetical protein
VGTNAWLVGSAWTIALKVAMDKANAAVLTFFTVTLPLLLLLTPVFLVWLEGAGLVARLFFIENMNLWNSGARRLR